MPIIDMPDTPTSTHSLLSELADIHPGEIAALVRLPKDEAVITLKAILEQTVGVSREDKIERMADTIRAVVGPTRDVAELVTSLDHQDAVTYESICTEVLAG